MLLQSLILSGLVAILSIVYVCLLYCKTNLTKDQTRIFGITILTILVVMNVFLAIHKIQLGEPYVIIQIILAAMWLSLLIFLIIISRNK